MNTNTDPHTILGVPDYADADEVKQAYRRLAMRWHPDRNPDPDAAEHFQVVRAAYEMLTQHLGKTDNEATAPKNSKTPSGTKSRKSGKKNKTKQNNDDDETSSNAEQRTEKNSKRGKTQHSPPPVKKADIRRTLELSLEEAQNGGLFNVEFERRNNCPRCAGSGESGLARSHFCEQCHGSGRVSLGVGAPLEKCSACEGKGFIIQRICPDCQGSGQLSQSIILAVNIPAGLLSGEELRLSGQGEQALPSEQAEPGDLYLTITLQPHRLFTPHGRDLSVTVPVNGLALLAGCDIPIPTLDGTKIFPAPNLPLAGDWRLPQQGYSGRDNEPAGDLLVRLQPIFPSSIDESLRPDLARIAQQIDTDAMPELVEWQRFLSEQ